MSRTPSPRPSQTATARTVLRTRAGRELAVGYVRGDAAGRRAGRVVLEIVQELDERDGVLSTGLTPDEARRLARGLLRTARACANGWRCDEEPLDA